MPRFMVVSYDNDQQQTHYDLVEAPDRDTARQIADSVHPYDGCIAHDALNTGDLSRMIHVLVNSKEEDVITKSNWQQIKRRYA